MRFILGVTLCFAITVPAFAQESSAKKSDLHVLYLAQDDNPERHEAFSDFLNEHFAVVSSMNRSEFDPLQLGDADVVIVDWSQHEDREDNYPSPLGALEEWSTPTVLLGSAGLIMSGPWNVIGGAG